MSATHFRLERDESGASLVMAVIVMIILTTLSTAVLARTLSVLKFVRQGQDFDAALAAADAGLADALWQIDQKTPPSWKGECPRPGATTPCAAGEGRRFEYWSTKLSESEYVVASVGGVGDSKHGIQARVNRTSQFPYALFSALELRMNGTSSVAGANSNFYSYNTLLPENGLLNASEPVRIGSNATVICNGTPDPNVYIDWYSTQSECPSTKLNKLDKPRDMTIYPPPGPTGILNWENCPFPDDPTSTKTPTPKLIGTTGVLATTVVLNGDDGPYVCRRDVKFVGTIVPNPAQGPVKFYILPTLDTATKLPIADYALDISSAVINPVQSATRFQIFKEGDVPMDTNPAELSSNLTFRGVLFAPDTRLKINGGVSWAGSINVGELVIAGAASPNLKIGYDTDLASYLGPDWRVSRYREIPSSQAGFVTP